MQEPVSPPAPTVAAAPAAPATPAASVQAPEVRTFNILMPDGKRKRLEAAATATVLDFLPSVQPAGRGGLWFDVDDGVEQLVTRDTVFDHIPADLKFRAAGGSAGAGGGRSVEDDIGDIIARRWPAASRHVAYVTIPCQERGQFKIAATVILSDVVMTFYHKVYSNKEKTSWCWPPDIGTSVTVEVNDTHNHRKFVSCKVIGFDEHSDLLALQADEPLLIPDLDFALYRGQEYFMLGQSAQARTDLSSVAHGKVSDTGSYASKLLARGDLENGPGALGGAVFSAYTGKLLGICVGNEDDGRTAVLTPTALAMYFASDCKGAGPVFAHTA